MSDPNPYESPPESAWDDIDGAMLKSAMRVATAVATIEFVEDAYRGRLLTRLSAVRANLLSCLPLAVWFGGIGLFVLGMCHCSTLELTWQGWVLPGGGILMIVVGAAIGGSYPMSAESWYCDRKNRRAFRLRPSTVVDAEDPEAVCISILPRENLRRIKLVADSDIGLLKVDVRCSTVFFEGDQERYVIPGGSILLCEPMEIRYPLRVGMQMVLVRLLVHLEAGDREILIGIYPMGWRPYTLRRRRQLAEELCQRIALCVPT
jgi:hypothetical protein